MQKSIIGICAGLVLLLLGGVAWLGLDFAAAAEPGTSDHLAIEARQTATAPLEPSANPSLDRQEVLAVDDPGRGRVVLHVRVAGSGTPVTQLHVRLQWRTRKFTWAQTGADGRVGLSGPAGEAWAVMERRQFGAAADHRVKLMVRADQCTTYTIELPRRLRLALRVVDAHGTPVPHATIVGQTDYFRNMGWYPLGRCDPQGEFTYDSVLGGLSVYATADGHTSSIAQYFDSQSAAQHCAEMTLGGPGQTVSGRVVDLSQPVPGARVAIFPQHHGRQHVPIILATDAEGRYRSASLPAGPCEMIAFTGTYLDALTGTSVPRRFGRRSFTVPDGGADGIDIQCVAGAKVTGIDHRARETIDAQGHHRTVSIGARFTEPLWGIDQELSQFARPDAAGRYAIDGLLPGAYELTLVGDGSDPAPGTSVVLSDGQVLHWDPTPATPTTTRRIAVRVLDPTGEPVTAWGVVARRDDWRRNQVTDAEGRCVFDCDIDSPVDLSVMPPDTAFAVQTVRAAPGLTAFTVHLRADQMPTAQLTARLVGPGIDMTEVVAVAHQEADYRRSYRLRIDPRSGRAASGPMIPGQYSLAISRGRAPLGFAPPRPVAAETVVDFGEVAIGEPASILVVVADLNASPRRDIRVQLRGAGRESFSKVPARSMPEGILVADLPAGLSFEVLVTSSEMVPEWSRVHLAAGERHRISVTGRRGTTCVFEYATATATATATSTATATATATAAAATTAIGSSILIRDAAGTPLLSRRLTATDGRLEQALAPGRYELQIKCGAEVKSRFIQVPTSATPVAIAVDAPR